MRFENILHIYWTKGIFVCTKLYYFDNSVVDIVKFVPGINISFIKMLKNRFECGHSSSNFENPLNEQEFYCKVPLKKTLNIILSQVLSVNNNVSYLIRLRIIYQFLTKTYIGKCHAIGKPVRGQRTWSNAWTSYNKNNVLRVFISQTKKTSKTTNDASPLNFRTTAKKYGVKSSKYKTKVKIKKLNWF